MDTPKACSNSENVLVTAADSVLAGERSDSDLMLNGECLSKG